VYHKRQEEVELPKHSEETDAENGHGHDRRKKDHLDEVDEKLPGALASLFVLLY
jgi:hypothetical protein